MRRRKGKGRTQTGLAISAIRKQFRYRSSETLDENVSRYEETERAKKILQRGGSGIGRKIAYSGASMLLGESASTKLFTGIFGNEEQQEQAYRTIYDSSRVQSRPNNTSTQQTSVKLIRIKIDQLEENVSDINEKVDNLIQLAENINDNTMDKRKERRRGRKGGTAELIPKSSFVSGEFSEEKSARLQQLQSNNQILEEIFNQLQDIKSRSSFGNSANKKYIPQTYAEYKKIEKEKLAASKAMTVGGYGIGRKMLYGMTKSVLGERPADWLASMGSNSKDMEKAYSTLYLPRTSEQSQISPNQVMDQSNGLMFKQTETQKQIEQSRENFQEKEQEETQKENDEKIIKELEEIKRKLDGVGGGGIGGILAGIAALTALIPDINTLNRKILKLGRVFTRLARHPVILALTATAAAVDYHIDQIATAGENVDKGERTSSDIMSKADENIQNADFEALKEQGRNIIDNEVLRGSLMNIESPGAGLLGVKYRVDAMRENLKTQFPSASPLEIHGALQKIFPNEKIEPSDDAVKQYVEISNQEGSNLAKKPLVPIGAYQRKFEESIDSYAQSLLQPMNSEGTTAPVSPQALPKPPESIPTPENGSGSNIIINNVNPTSTTVVPSENRNDGLAVISARPRGGSVSGFDAGIQDPLVIPSFYS